MQKLAKSNNSRIKGSNCRGSVRSLLCHYGFWLHEPWTYICISSLCLSGVFMQQVWLCMVWYSAESTSDHGEHNVESRHCAVSHGTESSIQVRKNSALYPTASSRLFWHRKTPRCIVQYWVDYSSTGKFLAVLQSIESTILVQENSSLYRKAQSW